MQSKNIDYMLKKQVSKSYSPPASASMSGKPGGQRLLVPLCTIPALGVAADTGLAPKACRRMSG
jgi:hypothetical protein